MFYSSLKECIQFVLWNKKKGRAKEKKKNSRALFNLLLLIFFGSFPFFLDSRSRVISVVFLFHFISSTLVEIARLQCFVKPNSISSMPLSLYPFRVYWLTHNEAPKTMAHPKYVHIYTYRWRIYITAYLDANDTVNVCVMSPKAYVLLPLLLLLLLLLLLPHRLLLPLDSHLFELNEVEGKRIDV